MVFQYIHFLDLVFTTKKSSHLNTLLFSKIKIAYGRGHKKNILSQRSFMRRLLNWRVFQDRFNCNIKLTGTSYFNHLRQDLILSFEQVNPCNDFIFIQESCTELIQRNTFWNKTWKSVLWRTASGLHHLLNVMRRITVSE